LGDVQLSQTRTGLSAREREVSPTPFIPTRRGVVRHSPCTPWQPIQLGPKRGPSPLWTLRGRDHSPSIPAPCPASPSVNSAQSGRSAVTGNAAARPAIGDIRCERKVWRYSKKNPMSITPELPKRKRRGRISQASLVSENSRAYRINLRGQPTYRLRILTGCPSNPPKKLSLAKTPL